MVCMVCGIIVGAKVWMLKTITLTDTYVHLRCGYTEEYSEWLPWRAMQTIELVLSRAHTVQEILEIALSWAYTEM